MGSTIDKLNKALETKDAIREAIIAKGIDVPDDLVFADYPDKIADIKGDDGNSGIDYTCVYLAATDNGTNYEGLFRDSTLKELNIGDWDVSQATDMSYMFANCTRLEVLDLSNWQIPHQTDMTNMFQNCVALHTIKLDNCFNYVIRKVLDSDTKLPADDIGTPRKIRAKRSEVESGLIIYLPDNWDWEFID